MVKTQDNKGKRATKKLLKKNKNKNENMKINKSTAPLRRDVSTLFFPPRINELEQCWNTRKKLFINENKCHEKKKYHENMSGCGAIDASIEKHFGSKYKMKLFNYYRVVGDLGSTRSLLKRLISNNDVIKVKEFSLRRKERHRLKVENISIPSGYEEKFPKTLEPSDIFGKTKKVLEQGKSWIAKCFVDRIEFRDMCIKECNFDKKHQDFIMKLQVLYANTEMAYRCAKK